MRFIVVLLVTFFFSMSYAQAPGKFYARYGGNGYDVGYDVKQTLDKGYIITGSTSSMGLGNTDMYLLKLDSMGHVKFQNTFGNASNDIGKMVIQLSDSSYMMVGYTNSIGFGGYDIFLVKADKYGQLQWQKTIGGTDWDFANSMQQTSDGGFIITGSTYSYGYGNEDGYVIRMDAIGNIMWTKTFGGLADDAFKSVIQTTDGGFALCGTTKSYGDTNGDAWVFKLTVNGDSVWSKTYGGIKEDFVNQIIENVNSDLYIAGATQSYGLGKLDAFALRLDLTGNQIVQQVIGTSDYDEEFTSIVVSKKTPMTIGLVEKEEFPGFGLQFKLIDFNLNLGYINATDYGSNLEDGMHKLIATNDKGFASVGYTYGYGAVLSDVYFLKADSNLIGSLNATNLAENESKKINLNIFPNPVSETLNIKTNSPQFLWFRLFDNIGREVEIDNKLIIISEGFYKLKCNDIPNGIYFLENKSNYYKISISN